VLKTDSKERFSSRVDDYVRFRPSYPTEVISVLRNECGLTSESVVADIASGTGLFTRLLLENGNRVFGVEPNEKMRRAGEEYLSGFPQFVSIAATAEATTLPDHSMDVITCAQAAHWFHRDKALPEFQRILKSRRYLALIWNDRDPTRTAFGRDYEQLVVKYGTDYSVVQRLGRTIGGEEFFAPFQCEKRTLVNFQNFDYEALEGRLLSSSYAPQRGDSSCGPMLRELRGIFEVHEQNGRVHMDYITNIYFGKIS
jgi:SAM-dependent methyltransferase